MKSISKFKNVSESDIWNSENIYHLKTDTTRISNLINHYEIYKKIISLPGDVIECGVFKGISLARFLTFREILENNNSRKIYGFEYGQIIKYLQKTLKEEKSINDDEFASLLIHLNNT